MELRDYPLSELHVLHDAILFRLENNRLDQHKILLNAWLTRVNIAINSVLRDVEDDLREDWGIDPPENPYQQ